MPQSDLITDPEQLIRRRSLCRVLREALVYEADESRSPFLGLLQSGWRVSRDQKEGSHGMHTTERRFSFCNLNGSDAQGPLITPVVVGGGRVLITRNHLRGHPVRCANEGVTLANGPVQLG